MSGNDCISVEVDILWADTFECRISFAPEQRKTLSLAQDRWCYIAHQGLRSTFRHQP